MRSDVVGVGKRAVAGADGAEDPRVPVLRRAVRRLRRELDAYPAELCDRCSAEDELDRLAALLGAEAGAGTAAVVPETAVLRRSLLLITAAVGSVSALGAALAEVRTAIELFGGDRFVSGGPGRP